MPLTRGSSPRVVSQNIKELMASDLLLWLLNGSRRRRAMLSAEWNLALERRELKRLAQQIRDEDHFERILADIDNPEMRIAVRALLVPYVLFAVTSEEAEDHTRES